MIPGIGRVIGILKKRDGVSLIEVLAAVTILGIIAISFSTVFIQTFKISNDSNLKSIASQTAVKYMERYKNDSNIPEVISDESGNLWVRLPSTDVTRVYDSASNLYVVKIIDKVDNDKYSAEVRTSTAEDLYPPQSLYKITVKVYLTRDSGNEITSVTGLKRGV